MAKNYAELIQGINQGIPDNNQGLVSPADVRQNMIDLADWANELPDIENVKGAYNASTNTPTLTATPDPTFNDGAYYDVTVSGAVGFAGSNFTSGTVLNVLDKLKKKGTQWYRIPFDVDSFYNVISQRYFNDVKPTVISAGTILGTPTSLTCYIAPAGTYTLPSGNVTLTGNINLFFWDFASGWSYQSFDVVVKDASITNVKIADKTITPQKLSVYTLSKNLANPAGFRDNYYLDPALSTETSDTSYGYTDYIQVTPDTSYCGWDGVNGMRKTVYYDINKQKVGGSSDAVTTFTTPSNVHFVRVTYFKARKSTFQFEQASSPTSFVAYSEKLNIGIDASNVIETITKRMISDADFASFVAKLAESDITFVESENRYDGGYVLDSLVVTTTGALGVGNTGFARTTPQSVLANQQYTLSGINYIAINSIAIRFEDANNNLISYLSVAAGSFSAYPITFTTPSNCKYVVFTIRHSSNSSVPIDVVVSTIKLQKGASATAYSAYDANTYLQSLKGYVMPVSSVAGKRGAITLTSADISGLDSQLSAKVNSSDVVMQTVNKSVNIANPAQFTDDKYLENDNTAITNTTYGYTGFIAVVPGLQYTGWDGINGMRKTTYFDANYNLVAGGSTNTVITFTVPAGVFFVRVTYWKARKSTFQFEQSATATAYTTYNPGYLKLISVLGATTPDIPTEYANTAIFDTLTFDNSDKILFTGCSYDESLYSLKGKSWIQKLSAMSDYLIANTGVSGSRLIDIIDRLRKDTAVFGVKPSTFKPTYITLNNNGNEYFPASGETLDLYLEQFRIGVETVQAIGAKPIIGTSYHDNSNVFLEANLKEFSERRKIPYMGIGRLGVKLLSQAYQGFWGGSHPGLRTNAFGVNEWLHYLAQMDRPRKTMKVFRARNTSESLDNLNYDTIEQRFERFLELNVGATSLNESNGSEAYYDRLNEGTTVDPNNENNIITTYTTQSNNNEYMNLISGLAVSFTNYALIEMIVDKVKLSYFQITIKADAGLSFYLKNNNDATKYESALLDTELVFQVSKAVYDAFTDAVGTKYISAGVKNSTVQFAYTGKLKNYAMGRGWFLCFSADSAVGQGDRVANTTSIVRVSDSVSITTLNQKAPYRYGYSYFAGMQKPKGGWKLLTSEVTYSNGTYTILLNSPLQYFQFDKLKLLAYKASSTFGINSIEAKYAGGIPKPTYPKEIVQKQVGTELITTRGFDVNWTTTGGWTANNNSLVSMPTNVRDYPPYLTNTSHVELGFDADGFSQKISRTINLTALGTNRRGFQRVIVRIVARLFPNIFNPSQTGAYFTNTAQITQNSYDLGVICIGFRAITGTYPEAVMRKLVDIGWQEVTFETTLPAYNDTFVLDIWRDCELDKNQNFPMQVFDVSLQVI